MFRPPTKYSEYLIDVRKSIDYILKRVNATTVTKIVAGTNVTISPASGTGAVTINASGGGGGGLPVGGTTGQILAKINNVDYNAEWIDNYAQWTSTLKQEVKASESINKGQAVYVSTADGTNMIVSKSSNTTEATSSKTLGLLAQNLAINGKGFVITEGLLSGLDTSTANIGDPVWLGANGNLIFGLVNKPYAPLHLVSIGVVTRVNSNNGEIFVKVQNGFELDELHNVDARNPNNNDGIFYNSSTLLWEHKPVSSVYATPTLAQVTTAGNTTTNAIEFSALNTRVSFLNPELGTRLNGIHWANGTNTVSYAYLALSGSSGEFKIFSNASYFPTFYSNGSEAMRIPTSRNVLIGTTTDAGYKLDVNGTARVQTSLEIVSTAGVTFGGGATALSWAGSQLHLGNSATWSDVRFYTGAITKYTQTSSLTTITNTTINLATNIVQLAGVNALTYSGTDIRIGSVAAGFNSLSLYVSGSEKARILSNGNMLIGTTTDSGAKFTVSGSITAASALAQGVYFNNTLIQSASGDILNALEIAPTFSVGAGTLLNYSNWIRLTGNYNPSAYTTNNNAVGIDLSNGYYNTFNAIGIWLRPTLSNIQNAYGIIIDNAQGWAIYQSSASVSSYFRGTTYLGDVTQGSLNFGSNNATLNVANGTNGGIKIGTGGNSEHLIISHSQAGATFSSIRNTYNNAGSSMLIDVAGQNNLRLWGTGNVVVGGTTDAGYKLDVNGTARVTNLGVGAGTSTNNISGDNIAQFGNAVSSGNQFVVVDSISGSKRGFKFGNQGTIRMALIQDGVNLQIGSYANPASFVPYVTFDYATGNVGVGTTSPSYPFHISSSAAANIFATVQATNASASAAWVGFNDQSDNIVYRVFGSSVSGTQFGQSLTRSASLIANLGGSGKFLIGTYSSTDLVFGTGDQSRMRLVDSTGNFLVGTMTDAGNKLEVSGTINATAYKINGILGWSGIINIPTIPPISITVNNGIITNVM